MITENKKIVIIDEHGFSRVCSALLTGVGYGAEVIPSVDALQSRLNSEEFGLVVISYPYGVSFFDKIKKQNIPTIILSDNIDGNLIDILNNFDNSYCMIKPLDYEKFRYLVKQVLSGELPAQKGYDIV